MLELGVSYSRKEIHAQLGGSLQGYLPHVGKRVVAACLRHDTNPHAPFVILVGTGEGIQQAADWLCHQEMPVPTFIKRGTGKWDYVGNFKVERWSKDGFELNEQADRSGRNNITQVIHMAQVDPPRLATRRIWLFGNPDKSELGLPLPGNLTQYIRNDIFVKENGRYRYTLLRDADVIVLSRDGFAYGQLAVTARVPPNENDLKAYPRVKCVYLVRKSTLYTVPVPLSNIALDPKNWAHG